MKVAVGLSGGVDSAVAAYLLKKEGHEVIGITMKSWQGDCDETDQNICCGPKAINDARRVAQHLDISYYVLDHKEDFKSNVIDYFVNEYKEGRTPNPCVVCNEKLKFGSLFAKAKQMGMEKIATGHYAGIKTINDKFVLSRGNDLDKDQSYFLFRLNQSQLKDIMFPLVAFNKKQVRNIAEEAKIPIFDRNESQEVCFVPNNDYGQYLQRIIPDQISKGDIVSLSGEKKGEHIGIQFYTIGQRKRLGAFGGPRYVIKIDAEKNKIIIGKKEDLLKSKFVIKDVIWHGSLDNQEEIRAKVQIRSRHKESDATIKLENGYAVIEFNERQKAITPGQAAVIYDDGKVLGGGWIDKVIS